MLRLIRARRSSRQNTKRLREKEHLLPVPLVDSVFAGGLLLQVGKELRRAAQTCKSFQDPTCSLLLFSALSMPFSSPQAFLNLDRKKYHLQPEKLASGRVLRARWRSDF